MAELELAHDRVMLRPGAATTDAAVILSALGIVMDGGGEIGRVATSTAVASGDGCTLQGEGHGLAIRQDWRVAPDLEGWDVALTARATGARAAELGLRIELTTPTTGDPHWLVPGIFYGENRIPGNRQVFPRWDAAGGSADDLVSDRWSFRVDRTALPAVFAWSDGLMAAVCVDETSELGPVGVGFAGTPDCRAIWVDAPWREEPVTYMGAERAGPRDVRLHTWRPGEVRHLRFTVIAAPADRHGYAAPLRVLDMRRRAANPLSPWLSPADAADLAAHGLLRWHYRPADRALYETVAFDQELAGDGGERGDRAAMHVAWVSGIPHAAALLEHGRRTDRQDEVDAGVDVIDNICEHLAPSGTFWGEWRAGRGWCGGWNPDRDAVHARTLAEATLFLGRALRLEAAHGVAHPAWESAVRSNLAFAADHQRDDGNLGSYYDSATGNVTAWGGAAGLLWVAALAEGADTLGAPDWLVAAQRGGRYYASFVEDELIYGAPEDVHLTPTSEDGYNAVIAYVTLAEHDDDLAWHALALRAAEWSLTFRYSYNVPFDDRTLLGRYDYRTRGGDLASPSNQHLHAYGLVCLPELVRLARRTGDGWLLERTREHLAWALQFIARHDGDFNAYRGMVSERFYQTDWAQAQGMVLALSHAWSAGLILYACLEVMKEYPEAIPD